jgi:hypothetical protein
MRAFLFGRLERIGLSTPVPQTGVLPLNYSRHVVKTNEILNAKPCELLYV